MGVAARHGQRDRARAARPAAAGARRREPGVVDDLLDSSGAKLAVIAIAAGLLAPIFEELLFRGVLLRALLPRMGPNWAIAVSAVTFGAVHFLGGNPLGTLAVLPALIGIGAISGVLAVRSGELSQSILLHMGFNLLAVLGAVLELTSAFRDPHRLQSRAPNADISWLQDNLFSGGMEWRLCTGCAQTTAVTIRMRIGGRDLVFHGCAKCESNTWEDRATS